MSGSFVLYFGLMSTQVLTHLGLFLPSSGNGILPNYTTALISSLCHISLVSLNPPKTYSPWHLTSPTHTHTETYGSTHIQIHRYTYRETHRYTYTHTHTHTHTLTRYWTSVSHSVLSDSLPPHGLSTEFCRQEC